MKKHCFVAILLTFGLVSAVGCGSDNNDTNDTPTHETSNLTKSVKSLKARQEANVGDENLTAFVKGQYDLNFDILQQAEETVHHKNAMISTYSIQTALGMVYAGADGETATQMKAALHYDDNPHARLNTLDQTILALNKAALDEEETHGAHYDAIEIKTTNNLYFAPGHEWAESWLDTLAINYGAGIFEMRFADDPEAARKHINDVVSTDTKGRIQDLMPSGTITHQTTSVLTNAIYFKAPWNDELGQALDQDFHTAAGNTVKVNMLKDGGHLQYFKGANYQAVVEPLRDDSFEIMFVLPDEGAFDTVKSAMDGETLFQIFDGLTRTALVELAFPMYEFTTALSLKDTLKALGMVDAFENADFSKMTTQKNNFFVSDVIHKTYIGVNEKGIEAAAATAVHMAGNAEPLEIVKLTLDRPFLFFIYETQTRTPLFVGQVADPSQK